VNDQGGVAGRKINFISYDDQYSPPKTVEQVRRLIEEDKVAFLFNTLGTPTNSAIVRYVNQKKVPHLFVASGADKWGDYKEHPWTIGFQTSYRTEAQVYAKYILAEKPDAKIGIIYQNDDYGKDYPAGMKDVLGDNWDKYVIKTVTYEVTDPTVDSQITSLHAAGCDVLVTVAIPKFAVQSIRKVYDLGWKPMHILNSVAVSVGLVMEPVGPEKGIGIVSTGYLKDPTDPGFKDDAGMKEWRDFMAKYLPGGDINDITYVYAYSCCKTLMQVLRQCGDEFSRENIMRQATNLKDLELPTLLPGTRSTPARSIIGRCVHSNSRDVPSPAPLAACMEAASRFHAAPARAPHDRPFLTSSGLRRLIFPATTAEPRSPGWHQCGPAIPPQESQ
jgi:branched-chain amino acid transport system substrate-binding protein